MVSSVTLTREVGRPGRHWGVGEYPERRLRAPGSAHHIYIKSCCACTSNYAIFSICASPSLLGACHYKRTLANRLAVENTTSMGIVASSAINTVRAETCSLAFLDFACDSSRLHIPPHLLWYHSAALTCPIVVLELRK